MFQLNPNVTARSTNFNNIHMLKIAAGVGVNNKTSEFLGEHSRVGPFAQQQNKTNKNTTTWRKKMLVSSAGESKK